MKLNNKGMAISITMYSIIAIVVLVFFLTLNVNRTTSSNNNIIIDAIKEELNENFEYGSSYETKGSLYENDFVKYTNKRKAENVKACTIEGQPFSHITDKRDHKQYSVTQMGEQCWMAEDLRYTTPACLSSALNGPPYDACRMNTNETYQGEVHYQGDLANEVCPVGWHLPSDEEWLKLEEHLGMSASERVKTGEWRGLIEGEMLKAKQYDGQNVGGFNAKLTGFDNFETGNLHVAGTNGYWWASSASGSSSALRRNLHLEELTIHRTGISKAHGISVRCIKD